jgi:beta-xylosidase
LLAGEVGATSPWDMTWGDLGDGTYRNPVLNGDFADSDIECVGDTWYLIASTNHLVPGMTVLESRDLVNWRYGGHVWPTLSWKSTYDWRAMNGYRFGTWAGDLSFNRGTWYCYMIDPTHGLIVSTAPHPTGPWSEPVTMLAREKWTDPAAFWDEATGQGYLICNWGEDPAGKKGQWDQKIFKLSADGTKLLDEGVTVYTGPRSEAAKIYRIEGRWYILAIDWIGNDRKQIALRSTSDSIYGPYERKLVFERGNGFTHSTCQGSLVQTPDGEWWFMHQLVQNGSPNFHGRPQALQPVRWVDGWPQIGADVDGDGVGEPLWTHEKPPVLGTAPWNADEWQLATSDGFEAPALGRQWLWNHNPRSDRWSLTARPGWMTLVAGRPMGVGGFWGAANTLSQRILGTGRGDVTTCFDLAGMQPGQRAGLVHFSARYALVGVSVASDGTRYVLYRTNGKETTGPVLTGSRFWVRSTWLRDEAKFDFSLDGTTWQSGAPAFKLNAGHWRGDCIGVCTWNEQTDDAASAGTLAIDFFNYHFAPVFDGPAIPSAR